MARSASLRELFDSAPVRATVVDVSARDGLQAVERALPPPARAAWVRRVLEAGVPEAEAGSFVDPRRVPQMAGTAGVLAALGGLAGRCWVLVPNLRGLEEAAAAGARNVVCLVSATETHSRANLGRPVDRVLADLGPVLRQARSGSLRARVAVSVAWTDPVEGEVPPARVREICAEIRGLGAEEATLCDTAGGASPRAVWELVEAVGPWFPPDRLGLHFHDPWGAAAANVFAGLLAGVARFEASLGGLGGCPFAPGARGNVDLETVLELLEGLGVATGVDRRAVARARRRCLVELEGGEPPNDQRAGGAAATPQPEPGGE